MSVIKDVIAEKRAERRTLMARAEVLAKQINDLEKEASPKVVTTKPVTKTTTKPATARKTTKPARKSNKK